LSASSPLTPGIEEVKQGKVVVAALRVRPAPPPRFRRSSAGVRRFQDELGDALVGRVVFGYQDARAAGFDLGSLGGRSPTAAADSFAVSVISPW
jgi:hypothetical protein